MYLSGVSCQILLAKTVSVFVGVFFPGLPLTALPIKSGGPKIWGSVRFFVVFFIGGNMIIT